MSHGWNSVHRHARQLYDAVVRDAPATPAEWIRRQPRNGRRDLALHALAGRAAARTRGRGRGGGGAAGRTWDLLPQAGTLGAPVAALSAVYPGPGQQQILSQLAALLNAAIP